MKNSGQQGVSLIIVLIMLGVIALTSAAALRSASSSERVGNNFRMQQLAFGYAEAALRYCEAQLTLADAARLSSLQEARLFIFTGDAAPGWAKAATWTGSGGAAASLTVVPEALVKPAASALQPLKLPECAVEKQSIPVVSQGVATGSGVVYVVTARGFSPDFTQDAKGLTVTGAVVWLQSLVAIERAAPADAGRLADRSWRRIINTPIY
jgi:Tfp pilus assembly protein PilX